MDRRGVHKTLIIAAVSALLLILGCLYLYYSRIGRFVTGIATVVVANDSGRELRDVRVALSASNLGEVERAFDVIGAGESRSIRVRTSDLYVHRLDYVIEGWQHSPAVVGIACPGERFVLSINGPDDVTTRYDW